VKITVECAKCGAENNIDIRDAVKAIIESADRNFIFVGFLCTECGEAEEADED
jgi:hypothetical protein